jgi:hypothetical protein
MKALFLLSVFFIVNANGKIIFKDSEEPNEFKENIANILSNRCFISSDRDRLVEFAHFVITDYPGAQETDYYTTRLFLVYTNDGQAPYATITTHEVLSSDTNVIIPDIYNISSSPSDLCHL